MLGALVVIAWSALSGGERPDRAALVLLAGLLIWAENAAVVMPTRITLSPSFMVVVASLAAFDGHGSVFGCGLVGLCGGLVIEKMRQRRTWSVAFNCAQYSLAGAGAAAAEGLFRHAGMPHWAALTLGSAFFAVVNIGLVIPAVSLETGDSPARVWADLAPAMPNYFAFGMLGILIGELYTRFGPLSVAALVAPLIVARSFFSAFQKLRRAYGRLEGLYGFTQSVGVSLDPTDVVRSMMAQIAQVLHPKRIEVVVLGGRGGATRFLAYDDGPISIEEGLVDAGPIVSRVIDRGTTVSACTNTSDPRLRELLTVEDAHDIVSVPVSGDNGVIAAILVADRFNGEFYGPDDVQTLETLAGHAAVALRNGRLVERLRHDSHHDALTGLLNRTGFQAQVDLATEGSTRSAVLLMDLSRFKEVNDTLGHDSGDVVLQQVGERLSTTVGQRGQVARLGGDEFAVLIPDRGTDTVDDLAQPLLDALDLPFAVNDLNLDVDASLGVALFPEHGRDAVTLLQRADIAMYAAKHSLRGFDSYHPEHDQHTPHRLMLAADLRHAIERGEFTVYYQPKAELPSGRITGVEALLRWCHPVHGFIPPDEFIPLAEHTGFIRAITRWTLAAAAAQCAAWRRNGLDLTVAVNLSARALVDLDLPEQVDEVLRDRDMPASSLVLEITESSIMEDPARCVSILERLAAMGITLSIDDFGTGYSSLAYLKRLPVSEVKVDKAFVINMARDVDDAAIVRSTIDLARNLRLRVVAEGVEDREVWERLCVLGCDVAQGYVLSRPVTPAAFERWLAAYDEDLRIPVG